MKCKSNTAKIIETLTKIDLWISTSTSVGAKAKGGTSRVAQQPMQWNKTDLDMIVNSRGPRKRYDMMADLARGTVISVAEISFHDSSLKSAITKQKTKIK